MRTLIKILIPTTIAVASFLPFSRAASAEPTIEAVFNAFQRPNTISTISYGDGDVNQDTVVDYNDLDLMKAGTQNDQADVDGDGIPSTASDISTLESHLQTGATLPGDWDKLETREQRIDWFEKMLTIDKTNLIPPIIGEWVCKEYAVQRDINFPGFEKFSLEDEDIPNKFDITNNGRFNLPVYYVGVNNPAHTWGHSINAILVGDNPLDINGWYFDDGSKNDLRVEIGSESMPSNSVVYIRSIHKFDYFNDGAYFFSPFNLAEFKITNGNPTLTDYDKDNLVLTRPTGPVFVEQDVIPKGYSLSKNFPNPFNPSTNIGFSLKEPQEVKLTIYNSLGQELETLVDDYLQTGEHQINWNASQYPNGAYFYTLKGDEFRETKKMMLVK